MTTWAPLAKSPNCASHIVKVSGDTKLYPDSTVPNLKTAAQGN